MLTPMLRRLRREESGAGMVEFAFVAVLLFTLIFGIIDFGRLFFLYNNMENAAREGGRFAAVQFGGNGPCNNTFVEPDGSIIGTDSAVRRLTRQRIMEFHAVAEAQPTVNMTCTGGGAPAGNPYKITIQIANMPFKPVTPLPFVRNLTVTQSATVRFEGAGDNATP